MALINFTEGDLQSIHYIFASLYANSLNKYALFNGHVYSKWVTKTTNNDFFH